MRSIALGLWIGVGSRDEDPTRAGISHLIEHLIFKGTADYSAWDIARIFDQMGGELNAATAKEYTLVHARFLDAHLDEAFAVMADMVVRPLMAELDAEREVVLEEVALYEDSPSELIHDYLAETVFWEHPLGRQIIGTAETLRGLDEPAITAYHRQHYVNPAIVVAAAGNLRHERIVELARRHFGQDGPLDDGARAAPAAARRPATTPTSCARTPNSSTSAWARLRCRATTPGASPCRCSTPPSAGRRARDCSRRSARSAVSCTRSTPTPRSTPTRGSSPSRSARGPRAWPKSWSSARSSSSAWPRRSPTKRSSAPRSRSRGRSCSAWKARRRA